MLPHLPPAMRFDEAIPVFRNPKDIRRRVEIDSALYQVGCAVSGRNGMFTNALTAVNNNGLSSSPHAA
jgi:hypothetical protein